MIVERDLIYKINPFLPRDEFISIIGPRQAGKTTLLELLRGYLINEMKVNPGMIFNITFEDRRLLMEFEKDPASFVRSFAGSDSQQKAYLMIDEFQYAHEGGQKLKLIYDTIKGIKIIITGSSSLEIRAKTGKFMVGRLINFYLYPFNFHEYLKARNQRLAGIYAENSARINDCFLKDKRLKLKKGPDLFVEELIREFEMYSVWGGYPAVVLAARDPERRKLLAEIYNNYILKDIKTLLELATEKNLFLLSQYLAAQAGNILVYQNLSQASGLEYRKLKEHLSILDETFICRQLRPFFRNNQKELSRNPKIYFIDMGFRHNLMENMAGLSGRPDAGAIVENTCFIRLNQLYEGINKINFWRTKSGAEVDFILHEAGKIIPIEVKYSVFEQERLSKGFMSFIDSFKPRQAIVFTKNYWGWSQKGKTAILFSPVYYL